MSNENKNIFICFNCKKEVNEKDKFCQYCGADLINKIVVITRKCPYCAEEILIEAKKCKHCGEYLDDSLKTQSKPVETKVVAKEGCFLQTLNVGCMVIAIIIVVIILLAIIGNFLK